MKSRLDDKNRAIELRKSGLSYKEIQKTIIASKGVLSGWFRHLELSEKEVDNLHNNSQIKQFNGRIKASLTNKRKRLEREKNANDFAKERFDVLKGDSMFLVGISLYWAEGSRKTGNFQFINSDPDMIDFMYKWIQKYLKVEKESIKFRLFTHKVKDYEMHLPFWANLLNVESNTFQKTIFKPTVHTIKKNPAYNGCLRLTIFSIYQLRLMKAWQKLLIEYYRE